MQIRTLCVAFGKLQGNELRSWCLPGTAAAALRHYWLIQLLCLLTVKSQTRDPSQSSLREADVHERGQLVNIVTGVVGDLKIGALRKK